MVVELLNFFVLLCADFIDFRIKVAIIKKIKIRKINVKVNLKVSSIYVLPTLLRTKSIKPFTFFGISQIYFLLICRKVSYLASKYFIFEVK